MSAGEDRPEAGDNRGTRDPRNVPGSGWVPTSPPVGFAVYGLDEAWPGARWLDSFGDRVGDPPRWVRLSHQSADGDSLIVVESYSRPVTDDFAARHGERPLADVASRAASILIDVTLPAQTVPRPVGFLRALGAHATETAGQRAQWAAVGWLVDGSAVTASVTWFAGGWAAVSDAVAGVYLSAVGLVPDRPACPWPGCRTELPITSTWTRHCGRECCRHPARRLMCNSTRRRGSGRTGILTSCG